jgi:ubiquinone/menaquinone biosynthesis C-methylase UbiE
MNSNNNTQGWGVVTNTGSEIWHSEPVFKDMSLGILNKVKLLFYPKKFFLYSFLEKELKRKNDIRILDVGCATGASLIDLQNIFGKKALVFGVDVIQMQVDIAKTRIKGLGLNADIRWYEGNVLPCEDNFFDAIYTSDVLGHVENVDKWLCELNRVLKPGGVLAMFSESKLGKNAYIRNYLMKKGVNIDPHAQFHISLYSKAELKQKVESAGFDILDMRTISWAHFLINPEEFYGELKNKKGFLFLKNLSGLFSFIKSKTRPFSVAFWELYTLLEIFVFGKRVEAQGYIVLARKAK